MSLLTYIYKAVRAKQRIVSRKLSTVNCCLLFSLFFLVSCSVTRRVPDDQLLLDRVNIAGDIGGVSESEFRSYARQQPNNRLFGLWRTSLCFYSLVGDSARTRFGRWMERVGQEPVLYDSALTAKTSEQLKLYLFSKGYYDAVVSDTMIVTRRKRCEVTYNVNAGKVYRINNISYDVPSGDVGNIVLADSVNSLFSVGDPFDSDVLELERRRITRNVREHGYYSFGKDYIIYRYTKYSGESVSPDLDHTVNCTVVVSSAFGGNGGSVPMPHRRAVVDSLTFVVTNVRRALSGDTARVSAGSEGAMVVDSNIVMRYQGERSPFKRTLMKSSSFVVPGSYFRPSDSELMRSRLASLKAFRQATVAYEDCDSVGSADSIVHLKCVTTLDMAPKQSFGFDVEGTNSSGNLGAAVNVRYTHANVFRGAESLSVKGRLATQHQTAVGGKEDFYTFETGIETTLTYPFMMFPGSSLHFYKHHNPKTLFSVSFDYQRRPEFTRHVFATRMTYNWRGSVYSTHSLTPIEFNVVSIPIIDPTFARYIDGSYLQYSYTDHFIMSLGYQFAFNQQTVQRNQSGVYLRFGVETAGNVLGLLTKRQNPAEDFKKIWNIRYAQYVKTEVEFRYQAADFWDNMYVARVFAGVGVPYGNSVMLPYEKSFFVGGANSIRAWPVRGLGPGSKVPDSALRYHNQTGDIRIEANAEYRFNIISILEGAAFVDAGNIWALNRHYNSPEAVFTSEFYKQIALGAGLGLRLNFNYFIFRVDAGYKLRDPAADDKWVVRQRFDPGEISWNFAIGYPF